MGKQWKQWQSYFLGLQNHSRWWLQPWNWKTLASWKKSYDKLTQHIKNQRYLSTKVHIVKAVTFPVVMYRCESWTVKKAVCQRIDAFELSCWRRLLRVPWTARGSNQSILKEINPEYSLGGLMLKLKLQYFGHLMQSQLTGKDPNAGKDWRWEEKGAAEDEMAGWHHQLNGRESEQTLGDGEWWRKGKPGMLLSMGSQKVGHDWVTEQQWNMSWGLKESVGLQIWHVTTINIWWGFGYLS